MHVHMQDRADGHTAIKIGGSGRRAAAASLIKFLIRLPASETLPQLGLLMPDSQPPIPGLPHRRVSWWRGLIANCDRASDRAGPQVKFLGAGH